MLNISSVKVEATHRGDVTQFVVFGMITPPTVVGVANESSFLLLSERQSTCAYIHAYHMQHQSVAFVLMSASE